MVKPARQNIPCSRSICPVPSPQWNPCLMYFFLGWFKSWTCDRKISLKIFWGVTFKLFWALLFSPLLLGREVAGTVTLKQIYEIAKIKKQDSSMKNVPMESLCKIIIGSTRSMGIEVVPGRDEDTWHNANCVRFLQRCCLDCHAIFSFGLSRNRIFRSRNVIGKIL